jgi:hypothetical protein
MSKKTNILALVAAGAITVLAVAGLSQATTSAKPVNNTPPTIAGTDTEGQTLTATSGTWTGSGPVTYSWQWRRCDKGGGSCSSIGGATKGTYTLTSVDVGNTIRVRQSAKNSDGTSSATSSPTDVVKSSATPPNTTGCPTSGTGGISVSDVTSPAHLAIDGQQITPSPVTRDAADITVRIHVSACKGRSVAGSLVYATAVPFEQFNVPPEAQTGSDGWASLTLHQASFFPASSRQQLLTMFIRARKSGEDPLGGISARRLISFPMAR